MLQQAAALYQQKHYERAALLCQKLLRQEPENSQAYHLIGVINYQEKRYEEAIPYLEKSIELTPATVDVYIAIAGCYEKLERYELAIQYYNIAYKLAPSKHQLLRHACQLLKNSGQRKEAIVKLEPLLQKTPNDIEGLILLTHLLIETEELSRASDLLKKLQALSPKNPTVWNLSGLINSKTGNRDKAKQAFSRSLKLNPNDINTKLNFASFLQEEGDFKAARELYILLIGEFSGNSNGLLSRVYYNLALIELGYGNFSCGWEQLKHRPKKNTQLPLLETLRNRKIAILGEEGLGDELMFLRFIPLLKKCGNYINYLTSPKLAPIVSTVSSIDKVSISPLELFDCDIQISAMDLPIILGLGNAASIPPAIPLKPSGGNRYLAEPCKPIIGLSWRAGFIEGGKSTEKFLKKEIPLRVVEKILKRFFGIVVILQRELQKTELETLKKSLPHIDFIDASEQNNNLPEILNTLSQLDTYIGVSNTNMHLYGSLGKKGCVIIPKPGEWRWMYEGEYSAWYPEFKLIRKNSFDDDWNNVIRESENYLSNIHTKEKSKNNYSEIAYFRTVIEKTATNMTAYRRLGQALLAKQDIPAIKDVIKQLHHLDRDSYATQFDIITDLLQAGFYQETVELYLELAKQCGATPVLLCNIGTAYKNLGEIEKAINYFEESLSLDKNYINALNNIAITLIESNKLERAESYLSQALNIEPDNINVNINCGYLMTCRQDHHKALKFYQVAEKFETNSNPLLNYNIGNTFQVLGELKKAEKHYRKSLSINPNYADAEFNLGIVNLTQGNFRDGWRHYFKRLRHLNKDEILSPISPGISLDEKRVHFSNSQGIGDEIFFLRFISLIKERYSECYISYRPSSKLYPLLNNVSIIDQLIEEHDTAPTADFYFKIDDIALLLDINNQKEIPKPLQIPCNSTIADKLKNILAQYPPPYTGIAWRAGTITSYQSQNNRQQILSKNFPLEKLIDIAEKIEGTTVIIQRHISREELKKISLITKKPFINLSHMNESLPEMLVLLDLLDDYIGVSSTNIHLLAARNRGGNILVPSPPDWRWMATGSRSVWMPAFKIYRQHKNGCWDKAIGQLTQSISQCHV